MKTFPMLAVAVLSTVGCAEPSDPVETAAPGSSPAVAASECTWSDTTCCDEKLYTDLDYDHLKRYMVNYREHVWSKTSPYFKIHPEADPSKVLCDKSLGSEDRFDARYLDITIAELENYICQIKNMGVCESKKAPDVIRIYYLRYDNKVQDKEGRVPLNYHNSHTLGFTPLLSTDKWNEECLGQQGQFPIWIPEPDAEAPMANHNQICPPLTCDHPNSMIAVVDGCK